ncbi:MAG: ATP-binding protein [Deltaproteobacteria bacterium]|nr:ATP-binding protein [Deltaproteobacteria bacterium]
MNIKRSIFNNLTTQIQRPEISILLGARQVGKTFLMNELESYCKNLGYSTYFLNLEIPSHLREITGTDEDVYNHLSSKKGIIFIDEFHYLKNASKIFKAIYDSKSGIKIFASGSSSIEIHKHLKESLAGRLWKNRIYPLTLHEYLQNKTLSTESFYQFGGLPGLINEKNNDNKIKILETIVETYISKDIKNLIKEENIRAFNHMLYLLAQFQGSIVTSKSLSNEIGLSIPTINRNLDILSHTYICYPLYSYSKNLGNELKKSRKYYLYDLGIRNMLLKNFNTLKKRDDTGMMGETFVFHNLIHQQKSNMEIRFWRTKSDYEVDFIVLKNQLPYPIEVKTTLGKAHIPEGLKKFIDTYPETQEAIIFCKDVRNVTQYKTTKIHFLHWEESQNIPFMESAF